MFSGESEGFLLGNRLPITAAILRELCIRVLRCVRFTARRNIRKAVAVICNLQRKLPALVAKDERDWDLICFAVALAWFDALCGYWVFVLLFKAQP